MVVRGTEDDGDALHQPSITLDDRFVFAPDLLGARMVVVENPRRRGTVTASGRA